MPRPRSAASRAAAQIQGFQLTFCGIPGASECPTGQRSGLWAKSGAGIRRSCPGLAGFNQPSRPTYPQEALSPSLPKILPNLADVILGRLRSCHGREEAPEGPSPAGPSSLASDGAERVPAASRRDTPGRAEGRGEAPEARTDEPQPSMAVTMTQDIPADGPRPTAAWSYDPGNRHHRTAHKRCRSRAGTSCRS